MSKIFETHSDIAGGFENMINGAGGEFGNGSSRLQPYNMIDEYMNTKVRVDYYRPLASRRVRFMRITIFIKRVIRKLNKFLVEPICSDVSEFNRIASMEFKRMGIYVNGLRNALDNAQARIEQLEEELREMRLDVDRNEYYRKYYEYHNKSEK